MGGKGTHRKCTRMADLLLLLLLLALLLPLMLSPPGLSVYE